MRDAHDDGPPGLLRRGRQNDRNETCGKFRWKRATDAPFGYDETYLVSRTKSMARGELNWGNVGAPDPRGVEGHACHIDMRNPQQEKRSR